MAQPGLVDVMALDRDDLLSEARRRVGSDGWRVDSRSAGAGFVLTFEHDLSTQFDLGFLSAVADKSQRLERFLARQEFSVVAARPKEMPNLRLIAELRSAAISAEMSEQAIRGVAAVLRRHDVLTEQEADWFAEAGPPWVD